MRPDKSAKAWRCATCGTKVPLGSGVEVGRSAPSGRTVDVVEESATPTLPTTQEQCPKCANDTAYWVLRQTRGADEPETRIFECTKCGHKWREYQ
ncbi:MAG: RPA12/RPB9/RPC11 RNA polymerase family protein [Thermoplasmata archaeon]